MPYFLKVDPIDDDDGRIIESDLESDIKNYIENSIISVQLKVACENLNQKIQIDLKNQIEDTFHDDTHAMVYKNVIKDLYETNLMLSNIIGSSFECCPGLNVKIEGSNGFTFERRLNLFSCGNQVINIENVHSPKQNWYLYVLPMKYYRTSEEISKNDFMGYELYGSYDLKSFKEALENTQHFFPFDNSLIYLPHRQECAKEIDNHILVKGIRHLIFSYLGYNKLEDDKSIREMNSIEFHKENKKELNDDEVLESPTKKQKK